MIVECFRFHLNKLIEYIVIELFWTGRLQRPEGKQVAVETGYVHIAFGPYGGAHRKERGARQVVPFQHTARKHLSYRQVVVKPATVCRHGSIAQATLGLRGYAAIV